MLKRCSPHPKTDRLPTLTKDRFTMSKYKIIAAALALSMPGLAIAADSCCGDVAECCRDHDGSKPDCCADHAHGQRDGERAHAHDRSRG